jgi:hypothetical protein
MAMKKTRGSKQDNTFPDIVIDVSPQEDDGVWEAVKRVLGGLVDPKDPNPPDPPRAPLDLEQCLAHKARMAGMDPVHFERGAKAALVEIERAAAGKHGDEAYRSGLEALDGLGPQNDAHAAGINTVRDVTRVLRSGASLGPASPFGGPSAR